MKARESADILRGFVNVTGGQLHYRRVGSGPPVLLLHPSPQSGAFSMPMALRLAANFTAIAIDTPGYGLSDPLPGKPSRPELADYLPPLREFMDAMGIERAAIYGNATGAEIAHLFAHALPERVALCMIDTAGHRADSELDATLDGYFPDVTPRRDGGYLLTHWDMVRSLSLFSPWQKLAQDCRLDIDMPPANAIHQKLLDYLRAGRNYAAAYRPAFYTAKHELIRRVSAPATLTRWEGKPDLSEVDDLIARGLPANFTILRAGKSMEERLAVAEQHLLTHYRPQAGPCGPSPRQIDPGLSQLQRQFLEVQGGRLLLRRCQVGEGFPLLALHDALASSAQFAAVLGAAVGTRPLLCPDLPGSGESDPFADGAPVTIARYAAAVLAALDALGIAQVDLLGWGSGGQVATELALRHPQRVRHIALVGPLAFGAAAQALRDALAGITLAPRWDGAHLVTAWAMVRDAELYFPWCERTRRGILRRDADLDPEMLDGQVQDLLKLGERWHEILVASLAYPTIERFAQLARSVTVCDRDGNAATMEYQQALRAANPRCGVLMLAQRPADWWATLAPCLC